jgi:hypothetical protein
MIEKTMWIKHHEDGTLCGKVWENTTKKIEIGIDTKGVISYNISL